MKNKTIIIVASLIGAGILILGIILYQVFASIDTRTTRNNENIGNEKIYWDDKDISDSVVIDENGHLLINGNELLKHGYKGSWIDSTSKRMYLVYKKAPYLLESEYLDQRYTENLTMNLVMENINGKSYLDLTNYKIILGIRIYDDFETNSISIYKDYSELVSGKVLRNTYIRPRASYFHKNYRKMQSGEIFEVIERCGNWSKIMTEEGVIGYIKRNTYEQFIRQNDERKINEIRENFVNENFNLIWHQIGREKYNLDADEKIDSLSVFAPTWFSLANDRGYVVNNADKDYVELAHKKGYKVWALVDNSFDNKLTRRFLNDEGARENFIKLMVNYSSIYDLDGINIDFENIYYEDRSKFTNFVEEFNKALKEQNLVTSIAISVPKGSPNWSLCYERDKLAKIVDYCTLMAYDEHWASSPKSGSVASYPWVKHNIEETLKEVPAEKLMLGIPFYMRIWTEKNGKVLNSKAISMKYLKSIVIKKNLEPKWLDDEQQYFVEYDEGTSHKKIWIEDGKSISVKMNLVDKYNLVGGAFWKKGLETADIWSIIK